MSYQTLARSFCAADFERLLPLSWTIQGRIVLFIKRTKLAESLGSARPLETNMGGCCGKEDADEHRRPPPGRRPSRPRAFQGAGHTLGGGGADSATAGVDARDAATMAAMQRANNVGGTERDRKMAERRQKDELVGKILAHYQARGQDPPIGLPASDIETLRKHLAHVKREAAAKGSTARPPQIAL